MLKRALILVPLLLLILVGLFFLLRPASTPESVQTRKSTPDRSQEKTFDLAIAQGSMTPSEITPVDEGDQVRFRITSDSPMEFHLHGYDLEAEVEPGEPAELAFEATVTGRFDIENEQTREELGMLLVQPR